MTVIVTKPAVNLREELASLNKPSGIVGESILRADTAADAVEQLNLEDHTFTTFTSTGIDDNATSTKLTVSDTGIDVTGTVTADGLTVSDADGATIRIESSDTSVDGGSLGQIEFYSNDSSTGGTGVKGKIETVDATGFGVNYEMNLYSGIVTGGVNALRKQITMSNGDIYFYEDTGTTPKFFWDASAESLGIGTSSPAGQIEVNAPTSASVRIGNTVGQDLVLTGGASGASLLVPNFLPMTFSTSNTERMRIDSSGNIGIGTSSPDAELHVEDATGNAVVQIESSATGFSAVFFGDVNDGDVGQIRYDHSDNSMRFGTNATAERMRIDSSGNVGIGTSSPSAPLSINAATNGAYAQRLGVDDPGTGTISSVKIGFDVKSIGSNPEPAAYIGVEEASTSSVQGSLTFATRQTNNNTVVPTEAMRIDSSGNLLVGKASTSFSTDGTLVSASGEVNVTRNGAVPVSLNRRTSDGSIVNFAKDGTTVGSISVTGSATSYNTSSDYRLKTDAQPMTGASARVQALKPVNFEWIADGTRVDGFLAHEAQEVVPEAVTGTKDAVDADGNPEYQGIDQSKLVPLLTAALQEALTKIDALENRITALEG